MAKTKIKKPTIEDLDAIRTLTGAHEVPQDGSVADIWADVSFLLELEQEFGLSESDARTLSRLVSRHIKRLEKSKKDERNQQIAEYHDEAGEIAMFLAGSGESTLASPTNYSHTNPKPLRGGSMSQS